MAKEKTKKTGSDFPAPSLKMYRRIALGFVIIVAITLITVVYGSLVRAEIRITPLEQEIASSFLVDVTANGTLENEVRGKVIARRVDVSDQIILEPDDENAVGIPDKAKGMITITNNRGSSQQLVATTRFLSEVGILFRLDDGVSVPANGTLEAAVTADEEGEAGNIGPSKFSIPGLNESAQKLVYGETTSPMTGGLRYVHVLSQEDLDNAEAQLQSDALESVKAEMREEVAVFDGEAFVVETAEKTADTEPGTETDRFSISLGFNVIGVFFDRQELVRSAERLLYKDVEKGLQPVGINPNNIKISVEHFDVEAGTATIRIELNGRAIPSGAHEALARGIFAGMTPDEVVEYFNDHGLAKTVEVELRPSWRKRVPNSQNKIKLLIQEN